MRTSRCWMLWAVLGGAAALAGCGNQAPADDLEVAPHVGDPLVEADAFIAKKGINKGWADWRIRLPRPPRFGFPTDKKVYWTLDTTQGRIVARLWPDIAPLHVSSFIYLTRLGFYDGLLVHRVVQGFMAQGGCPFSVLDPARAGQGWPGYSLPLEVRPGVNHDRAGLLSTARSQAPNSDGSQFFITFGPTSMLDARPGIPGMEGYTLFGEVVEGMDAVRAIEALGVPKDHPPRSSEAPRERIVIRRATVELR